MLGKFAISKHFGAWKRVALLFGIFVVVALLFSYANQISARESQLVVMQNSGCDPSKPADAYVLAAQDYEEKALYFLAIESYSCAIAFDPQRMQLYSFRANVLMTVGQFEQAKADIEKVLATQPNSTIPHSLLARVYFEQGQYQDALTEIDKTLALNDLETDSYLIRGQIYVKLSNEAKALDAFNQYFREQKHSIFEALGYAEIGFTYEHFGDQELATRYLRQAVALHGDVGTLYLSRAQTERTRLNYTAALENLNKAIRLKTPELVSAYFERAAIYMALKDDAKALDDCDRIIQLQGQKADGYVCTGAVQLDLRQSAAAFRSFNRAIELEPTFVSAYSGRAMVEMLMRKYDLTLADVNVAIGAEALVSNHYKIRAQIYTALGNVSAALDDYETYLRLQGGVDRNPDIVTAIRRLKEKMANV